MRFIFAILLIFLSTTINANPIRGIFFQPSKADIAIPVKNWPKIFSIAKEMGFNTIIFQWTRYGDLFAEEQNKLWLKARIIEASQANLNLIIGLSGDPDVFIRLKQPPEIVGSYFRKLNEDNILLARKWAMDLPQVNISGWYLPLEIDDQQWRNPLPRRELTKYLKREVNDLKAVLPIPTYISGFFSGNMTPNHFSKMLHNIELETKVHLWIQDGSGTNVLTRSERNLYLNAINNCSEKVASGIIFELFMQTKQDNEFMAIPLSPEAMSDALKQKSPCNKSSLFFALNYIIDFKNPN